MDRTERDETLAEDWLNLCLINLMAVVLFGENVSYMAIAQKLATFLYTKNEKFSQSLKVHLVEGKSTLYTLNVNPATLYAITDSVAVKCGVELSLISNKLKPKITPRQSLKIDGYVYASDEGNIANLGHVLIGGMALIYLQLEKADFLIQLIGDLEVKKVVKQEDIDSAKYKLSSDWSELHTACLIVALFKDVL